MKILLIDDEQDIRKSLSKFLGKLGHHVTCAGDAEKGLALFHSRTVDVVITDIRMQKMDGLELLRRLKDVERSLVDVIIITGHGDLDSAINALKLGAFDYLQKPVNVKELALTLQRLEAYKTLLNNYTSLKMDFTQRLEVKSQALRNEAEQLRRAYMQEVGLDEFRVHSDAMRRVVSLSEKYSQDPSLPVLIQGESGTGKELVARYTHYYSKTDPLSPFVAINCAAISPQLFEGEFFGHEPGAYTGATTKGAIGKLEAAEGGTVFLDEIGEMPLELQVKLLRIIEEKKFFRLGSVKEIPVKVRFICATNKDLRLEIEEGRFRTDLFYRINICNIAVPSLRERQEDILPLAQRFATRACVRKGKTFGGFAPSAVKRLESHPWPGNVRQLKNVMERLALLGPSERVGGEELPFEPVSHRELKTDSVQEPILGQSEFQLPDDALDLELVNNQIIARALEKNQGNITKTAQYLGISRRVLQGRIKKMTDL